VENIAINKAGTLDNKLNITKILVCNLDPLEDSFRFIHVANNLRDIKITRATTRIKSTKNKDTIKEELIFSLEVIEKYVKTNSKNVTINR